MKLNDVKDALADMNRVSFKLPDGEYVPDHFHITEVGLIKRHFVDCGGTERQEKKINFQLWEANDYDHRLAPEKLLNIITLSEKVIGHHDDAEVEVEYQQDTIGKYGLEFDGDDFILTARQTDCLAKEACDIPGHGGDAPVEMIPMDDQSNVSDSCCSPDTGCC